MTESKTSSSRLAPLALSATVLAIAMMLYAGVTMHDQGAVQTAMRPEIFSEADRQAPQPQAAENQCQEKVVDGVLKICCGEPFSPDYRCRDFAGSFVDLCNPNGLNCSFIKIVCEEPIAGHAIVEVIIDGQLCLVEPQIGTVAPAIISCDVGTPEKYQAAVCKAMGRPADCKCKSENLGHFVPPPGVLYCAVTRSDEESCRTCCKEQAQVADSEESAKDFINKCNQNCTDITPYPKCKTCSMGFTSDACNVDTCEQYYNTGRCLPNRQCKVVTTRCASPGLCKKKSSSSASNASSGGSSSRSSANSSVKRAP